MGAQDCPRQIVSFQCDLKESEPQDVASSVGWSGCAADVLVWL